MKIVDLKTVSGDPKRSISSLNIWFPTPGTDFKENQGSSLSIYFFLLFPCQDRSMGLATKIEE